MEDKIIDWKKKFDVDWKKKFDDLKEENKNRYREPEPTEKICPFMSTPEKQVTCSSRCKLYRSGNRGFECYFMELRSISWNLRKN